MDKEWAKAILNHADLAPDDIVEMVKTADNLPSIVKKLVDGTHSQALGNFLDSTKKYWDYVNTQVGKTEADTWVRNNVKISKKALSMPDADVAKMADIPHAAQEAAAKAGAIIEDAIANIPEVSKVDAEDIIFGAGMKSGNEIVDVTQAFADEIPSNWYTKARHIAGIIPNRIKTKWASLKRYEKVLCIWFMVDNVAFMVYMMAKFMGLGPGDRGFAAWNLAKSVTDAKWLCKESCEDKRFSNLENDIIIFEAAINNLEAFLDKYEFSLKLSNSYNGPESVLDIGKSSLKLYQECLTNKGIDVDPSTGTIVFLAEDADKHAVIAAAYVDGDRVGTIWVAGLVISEVNPGSRNLEVKATGYTGCAKTVNVVANKTTTYTCTLQQIGECSTVTNVAIYSDPLSPKRDQLVSFNGSAKSNDPITSWAWDFGDDSTATGQVVTHKFKTDGIYTVVLTVTNECRKSAFAERNVTVSEEAAKVGTIKCTSNQTGFAAYVDGVYVGTSYGNTWMAIENIEIGKHVVKIEKGENYTPPSCEKTVEVTDGDQITVDCQMTKEVPAAESTTLQIQTPIGADGNEIPRSWEIEIWVDGKDTACNPPKTLTFGTGVFCDCTAPWNIVPCGLGQHTITLKKYGYDDKSMSVYLEKDKPKTWKTPVMVKSVATPIQRTIDIVVPVGSALYVDGKPIAGTTTVGRLTTIFNDLRK